MAIEPITYKSWEGGMVDDYLDAKSNEFRYGKNLIVAQDGKLYCRDGLLVHGRLATSASYTRATGIYFGPAPFENGLYVCGDRIYQGTNFAEIRGYETGGAGLPNKKEGGLEQGTFWRGQFIVCPNGNGFTESAHTQPQRIYCKVHSATPEYHSVQLGLPRPAAPVAGAYTAGANQYLYSFHWTYSFTDWEGTTFVEQGPIVDLEWPALAADPGSNSITVDSIPVLASGNLDVANIKLRIARTVGNGTASYYVANVDNGVTSYVDTLSDADLVQGAPLYIDGGDKEWTQPPQDSLYVIVVDDRFWYAGDGFITHSIQGAPGACPGEFLTHTEEKVQGLAECNGYPILLCDKNVYRVEGFFNDDGSGGYQLRKISAVAGCQNSRAVVNITGGIVWPGNGGFHFSDAAQAMRISDKVPKSYEQWANSQMVGAFDTKSNLVFWATSTFSQVNRSLYAPVCDSIAVLHLNFGIQSRSTFTTFDFDGNIYPSALAFSDSEELPDQFRGKMLLGDARGYVFYFDPNTYTDPLVDANAYFSAWEKKAIIYDVEFAGINENPASRTYATNVVVEADTSTNCAFQVWHRKDDTGAWIATPEIEYSGTILWDITNATWDSIGDTTANIYQHVDFSAPPISGNYSYQYGALPLVTVAFSADESTIQAALRTITGLGSVVVTGDITDGFNIVMTGVTAPISLVVAAAPGVDNTLQDAFANPVFVTITANANPPSEPNWEWNSARMLEGRRGVPATEMRSQRRQVRMTNALIYICRSDDLGVAGVSPANPALAGLGARFSSASMAELPSDLVGCFVQFEDPAAPGSYPAKYEYEIAAQTGAGTIWFYDPFQTAGDLFVPPKWQIRGHRKFERFRLLSWSLFYEQEGDTQTPPRNPTKVNA